MCTHTGPRFIISFEGCESHQPHTNSKILVPDGARTPNLSHWRQTRSHCTTGSLFWSHSFAGLATQQDGCSLRFIQNCCFTLFIWFIKDVHKWKLVSWYTQEKRSDKNKNIGLKWLITPFFLVIYRGADNHSPNASRNQDWRVKIQTHLPLWRGFFPSYWPFLYFWPVVFCLGE
jgi:hypothetical protein